MVSRRIFFKSISMLSGGIVLAGSPISNLAANSSPAFGSNARKIRVAVIGNENAAAPYLDFASQNPKSVALVTSELSGNICFPHFDSFLESGAAADAVLFTGAKNNRAALLKALKAGYLVWSDRPVAFTPLACQKLNNIAAGYFSKIQIAHVIGNEICLMENKIYSARV